MAIGGDAHIGDHTRSPTHGSRDGLGW
jgi:hypothetical protein